MPSITLLLVVLLSLALALPALLRGCHIRLKILGVFSFESIPPKPPGSPDG